MLTNDMLNKETTPKISVLLPVYNGASWISESIECVLSQSCTDFELIVIDDGSKDASWAEISKFTDPRIRAIRQSNKGLAATLNIAMGLARAPYLARQDQDDVLLPERLEKQMAFLDANPDVAMVGTWAQIYIGTKPDDRFHRHPVSSDALRLRLLFDNPFVHSSIMMRTEAVRALGGYSEDKSRQPPEDYEFWSRIARGHDVANLPEILTIYREMSVSMSRAGKNPFLPKLLLISSENIHHVLNGRWSLEDCLSLACIYHQVWPRTSFRKRQALEMMDEIIDSIGGPCDKWSQEMAIEAAKLRRYIELRFLLRYIPKPLLLPLLKIRKFLRELIKK